MSDIDKIKKLKGKTIGEILRESKRLAESRGDQIALKNLETVGTVRALHTGEQTVIPAGGLIINGPNPDWTRRDGVKNLKDEWGT